ncbi:pullulanase-type alpha-1,6-glucosidase [Psychromonas hadalis]|uniref:pullulanase-type alpha-1,6-glucosidase n=1 Tax=Psychromonas hadalis TaxID=211669 RepID=UPI0003B70C9F|nr:pullulanase-type alpha-1,6-glucosidase [Psychromonas hadalis]
MELKISTLARFTMPLLVAATLVACGGSNDSPAVVSGDPAPIPDLTPDVPVDTTPQLSYLRKDASYEGWGLHAWNTPDCDGLVASHIANWDDPLAFDSVGAHGAIYKIPMKEGGSCFNYIMHNGGDKEPGGDRQWDMSVLGTTVYLTQGKAELSATPVELSVYESQKAALIDASTVAWAVGDADAYEMHYSANGGFEINDESGEIVSETTKIVLTDATMPETVAKRYQSGYKAFTYTLPEGITLDTLIQGQLVLVAKNAQGAVFDATGMQLAHGLDAVYANAQTDAAKDETFGADVTGNTTTFKLWAPTAKSVSLSIYNDDLTVSGEPVAMRRKANGTWEVVNVPDVVGLYYRYQVEVYHASLDKVETLQVTDPYSLSLSANSTHSQVVDLANTAKPTGWDDQSIPAFTNPEEQVIYETHLRDLTSAPGDGGTDILDGKYTTIVAEPDRKSAIQLQELADAGMNTIQLLNLFDIATVDEENSVSLIDTVGDLCAINTTAAVCSGDKTQVLQDLLESYDPTTGDAQALMNDLRRYDTFNWGYDPFHYTTPEGSYATDAKGSVRIEEYRTLIMKLHELGYRVIMDVVYNHTNSAGTNDKSVLDKIVPGYYQRLNASGYVETSTCCSNTATENTMMGKLMTDSLVTWAQEYKIDGFRFDLMGHQPKQLMVDSLAAVKAVDDDTYFYGEGWNFGEVQDDALFVQATQANMAGTEIGTFSDRLRDAVRGGGPFDGGDQLRENQGFANASVWNEMQDDVEASVLKLRQDGDIIRLGMAGNLANFVLLDQAGETKRGQDINYNGQKAGYTLDPQENISYVSKHDNQTLWDNNMYKIASGVTSDQRAQMQIIALSTNMLGQGIPFFHMGSELLRSKSMQRDSYDSGDWFNIVNYDMSSNNWNVGLPREDKDGSNWPLISTIIADTNALPTVADIEWTDARFKELLKIRTSSPLFSLKTASDVQARVDFRNTGQASIPGVIVMSIDDGSSAGTDLDPAFDAIVTVINATNEQQVIPVTGATGFTLHEALIEGTASFASGAFTVPALTTAVFVQAQSGAQGAGFAVDDSSKDLSSIPPFGDDIPLIRGDMNGWGDSDAMTFSSAGIYSITMTLEANTYGFKVGNPTWGVINYGTSGTLILGETLPLVGGGGNISLTLAEDSVVTFNFDANNKDAATLTVTAEEVLSCNILENSTETGPLAFDIYVKGNQSSWAIAPEYQLTYKGNNTYQANFDFSGNVEFKLAGDNWDNNFVLAEGTTLAADVKYAVIVGANGAGNNSATLAGGHWSFLLTLDDGATTGSLIVSECSQ